MTGSECEAGGLIIYDGDSLQDKVIAKLCGWRVSQSFYSSGNKLLLILQNLEIRENEGILISYATLGTIHKGVFNLVETI